MNILRSILVLLVIVGAQDLSSQVVAKVKVQKKLSQANMESVVTIGGYYFGTTTISNVLADKHLKISNNIHGLKVVSFEVSAISKRILYNYQCVSDSLSEEASKLILSSNAKSKMYIDHIKAVSKNNDTLFLNPIIISLTN